MNTQDGGERMTKTEHTRVIWWLELVLKLGMLTVGFLQVSSLTFGKPIISIVLWPTFGLGGILLSLIHILRCGWLPNSLFDPAGECAGKGNEPRRGI